MKKLLASDLDGTLIFKKLPHEKDLFRDNDKNAIKKFKNDGGVFVVSTGRPMNAVTDLEEVNDIKVDYFVLLNGAYIANSKKEVVRQLFIEDNIAKKIIEKIIAKGIKPVIDTGKYTYIFDKKNDFPFPNLKFVEHFDELEHRASFIAMRLDDMTIEEMDKFKDELESEFLQDVSVYRNTKFVDVVPKGCSKGDGVKFVSKIVDIQPKDIYTIGDSYNDVAMFDITENSFTFNRAEEGVKTFAKNLVDDVAQCIENHIYK